MCPDRNIDEVRSELARLIDPVFVPRPFRQVAALPRSRTGKLGRSELQRLIDEQQQ